ncbi:hypothetical protein [Microbacterium sp. W4I20]|uniref:hypothetical protein n=1 Tax=Microbacterium sp. W4I20 TaxID=3042262 RepID=UPI00278314F6|nr:hypothetical protein [Microbacterium sp. W4I20]MDQ0726160.1 hypothetical protein [Microbacterium sp. W4I20]
MSRLRSLTTTVIGVVAVGSLLALSACAPEPEPTPTETSSAAPQTPAPEPYAGPLQFFGAELDWFLPTADEITATIPGVTDVGEPSASLVQISDGFGTQVAPELCVLFLTEASLGSIGARSITWPGDAADIQRGGSFHVLQFADETQAQNRMDDYAEAAAGCEQFTLDGHASSYTSTVIDEGEGVRAIAGALVLDFGSNTGEDTRFYYGVASVGNVLVEFWHPFEGEPALDTAAAAQLLADRAQDAADRLVDELTANPPVEREEVEVDASAPWNQWQIGFDGVGPLQLGAEIETVAAAAPGAEVEKPEGGLGEWQLVSPDGNARLSVVPKEEATVVSAIRAGSIALYGDAPADGSVLPRAGDVGVGDPVSSAMTAFPEGTSVRIVSAGIHQYEVSTRDGRLLIFHSDREVSEEGASIIGITAEDGTLRREYVFVGEG